MRLIKAIKTSDLFFKCEGDGAKYRDFNNFHPSHRGMVLQNVKVAFCLSTKRQQRNIERYLIKKKEERRRGERKNSFRKILVKKKKKNGERIVSKKIVVRKKKRDRRDRSSYKQYRTKLHLKKPKILQKTI